MRGVVVALGLALAVAGMPTPVQAAQSDAAELREQAAQAYVEGRYEDASELYRLAFQKDHDAWLLYARAAAEHRAGRYENAISLYSWYVATDPPDDKRKAAESNIAVCHLELASRTKKPRPKLEPVEREPDPLAERRELPKQRPLILDPVGLMLGSAAVSGFVWSAGLAIAAKRREPTRDQRVEVKTVGREDLNSSEMYTAAAFVAVLSTALALGSAAAYSAAKKRRERRMTLAAGGVRVRF